MSPVPDEAVPLRMLPRPLPGSPYTLFLRHGRYTPREQRALARLGFTFAAAPDAGDAEPCQATASLPDLHLSELLALLRPLHLTCSMTRAHYWYGERLRAADIFWYLSIHHDEDV
jgi:hypothetical protein